MIFNWYESLEANILQSLVANNVIHRTKQGCGLWLGPLMGASAALTYLKESNSYSEICLVTGLTGIGLLMSCLCLYASLSMKKVIVKDYQAIYFVPAIITSTLYLTLGSKGLLTSTLWGLSVGTLSTWGVIQAMSNLPGCFTLGEATVVVHALILFLISAVANLPLRYHLPPIHSNDIVTNILQIGNLFVLTVSLLPAFFPKFRQPKWFYLGFFGILSTICIPLWHITLDQSPLLWTLSFVFSSYRKVFVAIYAAGCLSLSAALVLYQIFVNNKASTATRKIFHVLAVLLFVPGLIYEQTLLYLSTGVIMGVFSTLELMRILQLPPLGEALRMGFTAFADEKDSIISLTPLYLLCGLSFPIWMPTNNVELTALLSGVLTVGVGDSAASAVGSKYGRHKWSADSSKTYEGTAACVFSQLLLILLLTHFNYVDNCCLLRSAMSIVGVSLVEARTNQIDNLALPLLMYVCLRL